MAYRRISLDERADWLLLLEAAGYKENQTRALAIVSRKRGAPSASTLQRWWARKDEPAKLNPIPQDLANEKKPELLSRIDNILALIADEMPDAIDGAPLSQLSTSFGIMFDKKRLLEGNSTDNHAVKIQVNLNADS